MKSNNKFRGFTLVEVMVTVAVSSILILGIISTLTNNQHTSRTNRLLGELSSDIRNVTNRLGGATRMAGYLNSAQFAGYQDIIPGDTVFLGSGLAIEGMTSPSAPNGLPIQQLGDTTSPHRGVVFGAVPNSEVLIIRSFFSAYETLAFDFGPGTGMPQSISYGGLIVNSGVSPVNIAGLRINTNVTSQHGISGVRTLVSFGGSLGAVVDNQRAVPIMTPPSPSLATCSQPPQLQLADFTARCLRFNVIAPSGSNVIPAGSKIYSANYQLYYLCAYNSNLICTNTVNDITGIGLAYYDGIPATPPQLIAENVNFFDIEYGISDNDGLVTEFLTSANVPANQWENVSAIRLGILMRVPNFFRSATVPVDYTDNVNLVLGQTVTIPQDVADRSSPDALTTAGRDLFRSHEAFFYRKTIR